MTKITGRIINILCFERQDFLSLKFINDKLDMRRPLHTNYGTPKVLGAAGHSVARVYKTPRPSRKNSYVGNGKVR